jgi:hypothetical protein
LRRCCFAKVVVGWLRTLCAEELAGDVQSLAAHNDNLLAVEQLLGDGAGKATEQVALAVDDLQRKSAICSIVVFARLGPGVGVRTVTACGE